MAQPTGRWAGADRYRRGVVPRAGALNTAPGFRTGWTWQSQGGALRALLCEAPGNYQEDGQASEETLGNQGGWSRGEAAEASTEMPGLGPEWAPRLDRSAEGWA